jgi:hypothetical protein
LALRKEADGLGIKLANDGRIAVGYILLISWVDDVRYFGTAEEVAWYKKESPNCMPITDEGESQEFVSLEIKQDLVAGTLEVTQSKYFLAAAKGLSKYLVGKKFPSTPTLPESWELEGGSDADRAEAKRTALPRVDWGAGIPINLCQVGDQTCHFIAFALSTCTDEGAFQDGVEGANVLRGHARHWHHVLEGVGRARSEYIVRIRLPCIDIIVRA